MTPTEAAWVREHIWTKAMTIAARPLDVCPCEYGPSSWCLHGGCHECGASAPLTFPETYITDRGGAVVLSPDYRGGHPPVWLADRVCRWVCPCDCHAASSAAQITSRPSYVQLDLLEEIAS